MQVRRQRVHHKAGHGRQHGGRLLAVLPRAAQRQQGDQLIRAIAQHQRPALGQARVAGQGRFQVIEARARITVDGHAPQPLAQRLLQFRRQAVGVFHGVQLQQPFGRLNQVGVHGLHIGADALQRGQRGGKGGRRRRRGRGHGKARETAVKETNVTEAAGASRPKAGSAAFAPSARTKQKQEQI